MVSRINQFNRNVTDRNHTSVRTIYLLRNYQLARLKNSHEPSAGNGRNIRFKRAEIYF